jgi:dTDP-4-dehydrorhamnose reductase
VGTASSSDKRWLIVGANGMLGSEVMAQLEGRNVTGVDLPTIDITDPDSVRANLTDVDVVVNCAAWTAVDDAETNEATAFTVNAVGPALLAARCAEIDAKLVQISTDYVFDGAREGAYPEDFGPNPRSAYGRTKAAGEWAVRAELPDASWILRTAWLYGAGGPNFVKTMVKLEGLKPELQVVDDQHGQPTWARDLAKQIVAVVDTDTPAGIYHATSSGETTWFGLTQFIFELAGADPQRVQPTTTDKFPRPAPRPANSVLRHDKWATVGLSPLPAWEESLRAAWKSGAFTNLD